MKAVAVPYVIALILGIIVVAVIGYWFFVVAGGGGGQLSQTQCEAQFIAWCTQYSASGYTNPPGGAATFTSNTAYKSCSAYPSDSIISTGDKTACQNALHQTSTSTG